MAVACGVRFACRCITGYSVVIVRVTCGARSVHSAASTSVCKEREHLVYIAERLDRMSSLYSVSEPRGSVCVVI